MLAVRKFQHTYFIFILVFFVTSCIPPVQGPPPDPRSFDQPDTDLYDLGESLPYFEDFMYALEKTHLTYLMVENGPYTVFAPVQASFSIFRINNMINHLDEFPEDKLAENPSLSFYIWEMEFGRYAAWISCNTFTGTIDLYIEKKDVFRINGLNTIDEPDLATVNGYIQSIKTILKIPFMIDHLLYNKEFSLILEILERDDVDPDLLGHFRKGDPVTFLAPTDNAIISFLGAHPQWQTVQDIPSDSILKNHLVNNHNIVLNNIKKDSTLTTEYGQEFTIHIDYPQWSILGGSKKLANLSIRDIQAANGIIHQIDRVLIPERSN
jgi:uncharacterized surface protein with fasciclin (FAS1) repeats